MKRPLAFLMLLLIGLGGCTSTHSIRTVVSLDGKWHFRVDTADAGVSAGWQQRFPTGAQEVTVPHTWNVMEGLENHHGIAWYQRDIHIPQQWEGQHVRLKFGAVYHSATVYLNGEQVGEHAHSGYTTFYTTISSAVHYGQKNRLTVRVDNRFSASNLPFEHVFDWPNDGGMVRGVQLIASGKPSIRYVHVTPAIHFADTSGNARIAIRLWEGHIDEAKFAIQIEEKKTGKSLFSQEMALNSNGEEFVATVDVGKIKLWRFDDPFLYRIRVTAADGSDQHESHFGFRTVEVRGKQLLFNGEAVRLPGIEYMASSHPDHGSAEPPWVMDSVMTLFKELNATITRFHWPVDEYLLDLMDEQGMLAQVELPWWQQPAQLSPELMETAKKQLAELIEHNYNRPSIFAWGISNEVIAGTDGNQYVALKQFINRQDSTRLVNVVSNEPFKRKHEDESLIGDLPTWNEYIGTWFGNSSDELPAYFDMMESFLGDRPLLITENGLCEPRFAGGDARRIDDLLYHYKEWAKRDYVVGCIYFSLNDYRTHRGEDGAGRFKARIHGVTDLYLAKKPSFTVFKQLAAPLEIIEVKKLSNHKIRVSIRNKNSLPSYTVTGYRVVWTTGNGDNASLPLPLLRPGDHTDIELDDMAQRFAFEIRSPVGHTVTAYPVTN